MLLLPLLLLLPQAVAYIPPHQPQLVEAMIRWTAATMWAVKSMVRPKSPLKEELQGRRWLKVCSSVLGEGKRQRLCCNRQ